MTQSFSSIGSFVLTTKTKQVVFGDAPNDDLVVEQRNSRPAKTSLIKSGVAQKIPTDELEKLMDRVESLTYSDAVAQFNLNKRQMKLIKDAIDAWSSTHIRILPYDGKLRFLIFDCRMNDPKLRVVRDESLQVHYLDFEIVHLEEFSFTMKSSSFSKLPNDDYMVRVGDNSICAFASTKLNTQFLLRNQENQEPFVSFTSPLVGSDIVFAPVPNF
jgi:hypothetical protein